jgi:hypothetical protein
MSDEAQDSEDDQELEELVLNYVDQDENDEASA